MDPTTELADQALHRFHRVLMFVGMLESELENDHQTIDWIRAEIEEAMTELRSA
jgi:hypothetical protein